MGLAKLDILKLDFVFEITLLILNNKYPFRFESKPIRSFETVTCKLRLSYRYGESILMIAF